MSLRIDLNAEVRTRDGEDAGRLERAIFDPDANRVRDFVLDTGGLLGRYVLVPASDIDAASRDGDVLRLDLTKEALDALPTYVPAHFGAPPAGWVPPLDYGLAGGVYLWPTALITPAPDIVTPDRTETARPDAGATDGAAGMTLSHGDVVLDRAGDQVGVVDDVRINPTTGHVEGFALRLGGALRTMFGGGDAIEVSRSQIDRVEEGTVHLRLAKEELERAAHRI